MYDIIALQGKAGAGKDHMMQAVLKKLTEKGHIADIHEIISCTSRPIRENEAHGVNYYYYHPDDFAMKIMNDEMLEFTNFNNWWYGTSYESVRSDGIVNIGVFNPSGVQQLEDRPDCRVHTFWITAPDKVRLLRQLNRENDPNVKEIIRRFEADEADFADIDFPYVEISNVSWEDFEAGVEAIVCQVETILALGRD